MSNPLDKYDLADRLTDSKRCWALAVAEIRKAGVIEGKLKPINSGEMDLRGW